MKNSKTSNLLWVAMLLVFVGLSAASDIHFAEAGSSGRRRRLPRPPPAPAASPFLMEQQWLIKLKLAKAEEAMRAPQILSTGRVVPVPAKRAIVAPPVGGIIQSGTMPRIGQQVAQGQLLATLVQTPTAAEVAQIQAANTQVQIENTRVEAERRRLAQNEIEAQARLEEATHDLGRSQRLYEKKAYSAKALESDELARTVAGRTTRGDTRTAEGSADADAIAVQLQFHLRRAGSDFRHNRQCQQGQRRTGGARRRDYRNRGAGHRLGGSAGF